MNKVNQKEVLHWISYLVIVSGFYFVPSYSASGHKGKEFPDHDPKVMEVGPREIIVVNTIKPYAWPDGIMGVMKDGRTYTFFGAADGDPIRSVGTLGNPIGQGWKRIPIQRMRRGYDYVAGGPIYKDPESGTLLMIYHAEKHVKKNWRVFYSLLGMAKSTDGGKAWTDLGEIITLNVPFDSWFQTTFDIGGGSYLIIDGYFYVYFRDQLQSGQVNELAVARAKVSSVLSTAINGNTVVPWTKYNNGAWTEPGLAGRSSALEVDNPHCAWSDVSYNEHLGKYIMVTAGSPWALATDLYLIESSDGIRWSGRRRIVNDIGESFYVTILGVGDNPRRTGKQFYIYYVYSATGKRNSDGVLVRRLVTFK